MSTKVLVAPLNLGLAYATRCIPIIKALKNEDFIPVIASDGAALAFLQQEFPTLEFITLPSYTIDPSQHDIGCTLSSSPTAIKTAKTIKAEKKIIQQVIASGAYSGIISDNRLGVRHKHITSVFITHKLTILGGKTSHVSAKLYAKHVKKFDVCWVPDMADELNLSGALGHPKNSSIPVTYLGPLSRFEYQNLPKQYDIMVLLSGAEPERSLLEKKLFQEFEQSEQKIVFVRGIHKKKGKTYTKNNITIHNQLSGKALESTINSSTLVISRSGYATVMDLAKLNKKAFLIPTPGQFEQEYLANRLAIKKLVPSCKQEEFTLKKLVNLNAYRGLGSFSTDIDYGELFYFFQRK